MMTGLDYLSELHHTSTIKMLSDKLPYISQRRWRSKTDDIQEVQDRKVEFGDLVRFVEIEARIVNNPTYGKLSGSSSKSTLSGTNKKPQSRNQKRCAFAASVSESEKKCDYCNKNNHQIAECYKLTNKPLEDRLSYVKSNKLCFGCLTKGHRKSGCPIRETVKCKKCDKRHPTALHDPNRSKKPELTESTSKEAENSSSPEKPSNQSAPKQKDNITSGHAAVQPTDDTQAVNPLMAIVPVLVRQQLGEKCVATYAFLDNGCSAVFADPELIQELNATTRSRKLLLGTLNSETVIESEIVTDKLQVGRIDKENFVDLPAVYLKDGIPVLVKDKPSQEDVNKWRHLAHIQIPGLDSTSNREYTYIPKVTILIGSNAPAATMPSKTAIGEVGEPHGIYTPLGWAIYGIPGKLNNQVLAHFCSTHTVVKDGMENLEEQFKTCVGKEFSERLNDDRIAMSAEDNKFLDKVADSIQYKDGHYEIRLPFRDGQVKMPNNKPQAEQRANALQRKLTKDPEFYEEYRKSMQQTLEKGYAEPVPEEELHSSDEGKIWYVPHHGVYKKNKMRIVFVCAATYHGKCINRELLQGPDLTNTLLGVLLRFRQEQIGMMSDIKAMFCQVRVPSEDRDYLRFLWWPDGNMDLSLKEYRMTVHLFGATSSPACSNYALQRTKADNQQQYSSQIIDTTRHSFYVDDCLQSVSSVGEGIQLAAELMSICSKGGFHLTKWVSNSREVLESIPRDERAKEVKQLNLEHDTLPMEGALGLQWQVESNAFGFRIDIKDRPLTRRGMLSTLCSLYDPLGLVSPAILPAKQMLQELCKMGIGWDEDVPEEMKKKWCRWLSSIPQLKNFSVPRC